MVKGKKQKSDLGRALVKDFNRRMTARPKLRELSTRHTVDLDDGYKWDRLNLTSVTEESSFQEFLSTAELAGADFRAQKLNVRYVTPHSSRGLLTDKEKEAALECHRRHSDMLKIPRRPKWDKLSGRELQAKEKEEFLKWRRNLALFEEAHGLTMTPYEKNLEFWRQLWRVVDRSDIIVQIVDARNPLLFRCEDLERYVKEVGKEKMNMILANKADFLTAQQRQDWADYFAEQGIIVAFFSATLSAEECLREQKEAAKKADRRRTTDDPTFEAEEDESDESDEEDESDESDEEDESGKSDEEDEGDESDEEDEGDESEEENESNEEDEHNDADENLSAESKKDGTEGVSINAGSKEVKKQNLDDTADPQPKIILKNSSELLNREKLISLFKFMYDGETYKKGVTTVGLVGYPNVGKSSTINAIMMDKKVSVSATPGKTKHFQTLFVDNELMLCDCPGLVMPSFVCTKADMVLNGILPIDQLKNHVPAVTLVGTLIPRHIIEDTYGIMLPPPLEGQNPDRPPTSEEILNTYGFMRGFMTQNGQPNNPHSARYILKDFVNGKLLYCVAPPNKSQSDFHTFPPRRAPLNMDRVLPPRAVRAGRGVCITGEDIDREFINERFSKIHVRGVTANFRTPYANQQSSANECDGPAASTQSLNREEKPWKKINKHKNKNRREKGKRLYYHLDQY